jgi:hypothetical protein
MAMAGGGGGSNLHYRHEDRFVRSNTQASVAVLCHSGEQVLGGGFKSTAGFMHGGGTMISTSAPFDSGDPNNRGDDGWLGRLDVFQNAGGERMQVYAICKG